MRECVCVYMCIYTVCVSPYIMCVYKCTYIYNCVYTCVCSASPPKQESNVGKDEKEKEDEEEKEEEQDGRRRFPSDRLHSFVSVQRASMGANVSRNL